MNKYLSLKIQHSGVQVRPHKSLLLKTFRKCCNFIVQHLFVVLSLFEVIVNLYENLSIKFIFNGEYPPGRPRHPKFLIQKRVLKIKPHAI